MNRKIRFQLWHPFADVTNCFALDVTGDCYPKADVENLSTPVNACLNSCQSTFDVEIEYQHFDFMASTKSLHISKGDHVVGGPGRGNRSTAASSAGASLVPSLMIELSTLRQMIPFGKMSYA